MIGWHAGCVYKTQDKSSVRQQSVEASDLGAKLQRVEELERQIEDQKFKISRLREEKVSLNNCILCFVLCWIDLFDRIAKLCPG